MTITTHSVLPLVCTNASCLEASTHREECECSCGGVDHGHTWKASREAFLAGARARTERAGGVMAQLSAMGALGDSDDGWWNDTPATVVAASRVRPVYVDPDDAPF